MKHGLTGYVRHKCRCDICKAAKKSAAAKSNLKNRDHIRAKNAAYARQHPEEAKARVAKWRAEHPKRAKALDREKSKRYADKNREKVRQANREWVAANPEKAKAFTKAYNQANPHKAREAAKRRRVRVQGGEICSVSEKDWQRLCRRHDNKCAYCGQARVLQKDHIIPITRGGRHSIGNLLPACKPCNSSKGPRLLTEWRGRPSGPSTSLSVTS